MVVGGEERRKEGKEESRWKGRTEGGEGGRKEAKVLTLYEVNRVSNSS